MPVYLCAYTTLAEWDLVIGSFIATVALTSSWVIVVLRWVLIIIIFINNKKGSSANPGLSVMGFIITPAVTGLKLGVSRT